MFMQQSAKPVDLVVVEPTKIEGKHVDAGTLLREVPADLAMELAAAGKVRVATEEVVAEYKARAKAAAKAAEAQEAQVTEAASAANQLMANTVAAAVAAALQAAGVVPKA